MLPHLLFMLPFCCFAVLLFCCFAVLLFCCFAVLLFCCFAVAVSLVRVHTGEVPPLKKESAHATAWQGTCHRGERRTERELFDSSHDHQGFSRQARHKSDRGQAGRQAGRHAVPAAHVSPKAESGPDSGLLHVMTRHMTGPGARPR